MMNSFRNRSRYSGYDCAHKCSTCQSYMPHKVIRTREKRSWKALTSDPSKW